MNTLSISQLKIHPAKAITQSLDYPMAIEKRNKVQAYLIGKDLFEKMISQLEDISDIQTIKKTDFSKGKNFEKIAQELGI